MRTDTKAPVLRLFFALTPLSSLRHLFTSSDFWINTLRLVYFRLFKLFFFLVGISFFIYAFIIYAHFFRDTTRAYDNSVVWREQSDYTPPNDSIISHVGSV